MRRSFSLIISVSISRDDDVLPIVLDGEVVDGHMVFAVVYVGRFDIPDGVADGYLRWLDGDMGCSTSLVVVKTGFGVQLAAESMFVVVLERQECMQFVVGCRGLYVPIGTEGPISGLL